ncbi:hypothetical protein L6164_030672 [Bauhinia variegata]|uniref:Uncharacterized protein n=1 Tax=Bauhinia variegata TaxID=167791 RepID=A0ACB9LDF4_BAUVA|nr:hypothetical protein L6164_030672 [Bauhinia variegata]
MMTTSPRRDLQVLDFKEEDEDVDLASGQRLEELKSPDPDDQSTFKGELLSHEQLKRITCIECWSSEILMWFPLYCCPNNSDDKNVGVVLYPDYVMYRNNYYMGPQLTFSHSCFKINGSTASLKQGTFNLEWAVDDLIYVQCQLFQNNGVAMIKLRVISNLEGNSNNVIGTSGIEELKIVVSGSSWSLRHKQITSLNEKYMAIWNVVLGMDMEDDETDSLGQSSYFPNFDKPFEEIIYPKGNPDAVSLSKRDVDLFQPDTFVNGTIIDFYIKYLKNQIQEEEKHRFHFFNSFFFRKLADMDKNPSSASDGKAAFLRVRKWTRKINLFEKDYIFIPVNFNLIVIRHPGEVKFMMRHIADNHWHKSLKVACILRMDSVKGTHSRLKNLLQSYLLEEWKEPPKDTWEEALSSRFFNVRFLPHRLWILNRLTIQAWFSGSFSNRELQKEHYWGMHDSNENGTLDSSREETSIIPMRQVSDAVDDRATCDDVQMVVDVAPDFCEDQAAKRRRSCQKSPICKHDDNFE